LQLLVLQLPVSCCVDDTCIALPGPDLVDGSRHGTIATASAAAAAAVHLQGVRYMHRSCTSSSRNLLLLPNAAATTVHLQGVRYTHRSNFLHSFIVTQPDALCLGAASSMLMVVPMFHANSWGVNFAGECNLA
jgi:hypothetical protein